MLANTLIHAAFVHFSDFHFSDILQRSDKHCNLKSADTNHLKHKRYKKVKTYENESEDEKDGLCSSESFDEESDSDEEFLISSRKQKKNVKLKNTITNRKKNLQKDADIQNVDKNLKSSCSMTKTVNPFVDDNAAVEIDKQAMPLKSSEDIPKSLAPAIPVIKKSPLKLTDNISKTQSKSDFASEKLLMPKSSKAIQISKNSSNILDGDKDLLLLTSNNDLHKTTAKVANVIKESPIRLTKSAPKSKTRTSFIADNGNASKQNEICNTSPANAKTNKDELSIQSVESTVKTPLHDASVSRFVRKLKLMHR